MTTADSLTFVGGGIASVTAIESLRAGGYEGAITLFGAEDQPPYDRPPLSKEVLLDGPAGVPALRPQSFYEDNMIDLRLGERIVGLRPSGAELVDAAGRVHRTGRVVLATGGRPRVLDLPGAALDGVCVLRRYEDAVDLESRLSPGARVVVIGGGFIGTEVAAAAATRGADVVLLEALEAPLTRVLPALAGFVADHHRTHGVEIRTNVRVLGFSGTTHVERVLLGDDAAIPADLVVVGVGMVPNAELARDARMRTRDGVCVDERYETSIPGVFAIGDVASRPDGAGGHRRLEHWQSAVHDGHRLARVLQGQQPGPAPVPWFWSDQFGLNIQMAGLPRGGDDQLWRGDPRESGASVLFCRGGRVTGIVAVNSGRDIRPASTLIASGQPVDPDALTDPDRDLRRIVRDLLGGKQAVA